MNLATLGLVFALALQPPEVTVDAPPSLAGVAARVETIDREAISRALAVAGLELPSPVHIALIAEHEARADQTPAWVVGRAFGTQDIVIFPQRVGSYPYDSLDSVVLHEIVHIALNARAGGRPLPRWFHEGVAVSVESGWGLGSQARLLLAAARGPGIDEVGALFESDSVPDTTSAYLLSAALVEDIRRRHGLAVPAEIASYVAIGVPFDQAFLRATGETVDAAAAQAWRVYRGIRWLPILTSAANFWTWILALAGLAFVIRLRRRRQQRRRWEEEEERAGPPIEPVNM